MESPPNGWAKVLMPGDGLFLVKENKVAVFVEWVKLPFIYITGRMKLLINDSCQIWYVSCDGCGIDNSQLILPFKNSSLYNRIVVDDILT